jgi:SAM-dependent methyltransferase
MARPPGFEDLTETTGIPISKEAADMMYTRYRLAARAAAGRRVLELGCGAGQGLGLLGAVAASVVGGDYSRALLSGARAHYGRRFPLACLSADCLPFSDAAFDLVLCFEASYYVPDMTRGFGEMARVLRPGGTVMFVNANPDRLDFIRSPHSVHYHSADEFRAALGGLGLAVEVHAGFPLDADTRGAGGRMVSGLLSLARRVLEALHLVPATLRGRARLKRLIYGKLDRVPAELGEGFAREADRHPVTPGPVRGFKVLYISARKPGPAPAPG